jgi:hypothetical protein
MARTTFSGPVKSDNGFEGAITATGTSTFANVSITGNTAVGNAATDTVGFYGATQVAQPSSTGQTSGFTAGAGTAVLSDSTFTGGSGTKAYTIGDIVKHLKALGILAAS